MQPYRIKNFLARAPWKATCFVTTNCHCRSEVTGVENHHCNTGSREGLRCRGIAFGTVELQSKDFCGVGINQETTSKYAANSNGVRTGGPELSSYATAARAIYQILIIM